MLTAKTDNIYHHIIDNLRYKEVSQVKYIEKLVDSDGSDRILPNTSNSRFRMYCIRV